MYTSLIRWLHVLAHTDQDKFFVAFLYVHNYKTLTCYWNVFLTQEKCWSLLSVRFCIWHSRSWHHWFGMGFMPDALSDTTSRFFWALDKNYNQTCFTFGPFSTPFHVFKYADCLILHFAKSSWVVLYKISALIGWVIQ